MSERVQLTEEMRRLMGISRRDHGGLPTLFAPQGDLLEGGKRQPQQPFHPIHGRPQPLEERKSLTLFKDEKAMVNALERARKLVARVNATVQHNREKSTRSEMMEKTRAEMYRLDQEIATTLDALNAASEAIENIASAKKEAKKAAREARRQGRR